MMKQLSTSLLSMLSTKTRKSSILGLILVSLIICYTLPSTTLTTTTLIHHKNSIQHSIVSKAAEPPIIPPFEEEKYLAYLPHSGLSNQRIELANALLLSHMLNRTLIIPPAFLGSVFGWMNRAQLEERLEWLTTPKNFPKICQRPTPGKLPTYVQRSRCAEYRHFGALAWTDLHDFRPLQEAGIKIKFQYVISMKQIKEDLQLNDTDIYLHQDAQLYDWRLYQNHSEAVQLLQNRLNYFDSFSGRRYYKVLLPRHFQRRTEKLLYLGGIFGSTRFNLIDPQDKQMQEKIRQVLHYRLDTPLGETVKAIVNHLGGKGSFTSVHFRTGDNPFKKEVSANLKAFVKNMTEIVSHETYVQHHEENELVDLAHHCLNIASPPSFNDDNSNSGQGANAYQFSTQHLGKRVKVYIATDHRDPRGLTSSLMPWFDEFPCTTVLDDLPQHLFAPLDGLTDVVVPSKSLKSFLIPIVDAMVAAHGKQILTTPRSTFSKYIEELHRAWVQ
ncbi:hypothetical protein V8B55DRAFT_1468336 [Mucor lusitanicus]|uniref:CigA protein n=2 Tax=Mucor circinelloides f. lusitanicus TaxID=29924 RepID=A0A168JB68_MUCCL|nr:hypothetical protein FB192DRAFT_1357196 [Mucor lusitanicus]OAD00982.1 hypothetical protein MUCCIDRAFT_164892 [Mucor lusitanicus CBS 277.49]